MDAQIQLLESLTTGTTYLSGMLKEKAVIKRKAQKYGAFQLTSIKLVWDLQKMVDESTQPMTDQQKKAMKETLRKLLGEGTLTWYGTDGKVVVQVTAADWPAAQKLLDDYFKGKNTIAEEGNYRNVRKELPAEPTALFLFDLVRYVATVFNVIRPQLEDKLSLPANYPQVGKLKPSFGGAAVTLRPDRGTVDLYFSAQTLKDVFDTFVRPLLVQ